MRIQDFNPVIKEDNEMSDVVTAHGLMNRALTDQEARQEYFEFLQHLRNKHGKDYSTRIHQKAAELAKSTKQKGVSESNQIDRAVTHWDGKAKEQKNKDRTALKSQKAEHETTQLGRAEKYWTDKANKPVNEFAPPRSGRNDDDNYDLQLYIDVAKKLNMKKYKPATAHELIAKKMSELVSVVDDEKVDYARHIARKEQGLSSSVDETIVKVGSQYELKSHTGKNLGKYPTKAGAKKREQQVNYFKHVKEDAWTGENPAWGNSDPFTGENPAWGGGSSGAVASTLPIEEDFNAQDVISVDVPLLIRLLEYAREDAKTDMDLHNVTERLIALSQEGNTLTMQDYDTICNTKETD